MSQPSFLSPAQSLAGGTTPRTSADNLNGGFGAVTPPDTTTGVPLPPSTQVPSLAGPGGFNAANGASTQNIITDPNATGLSTPGMTTYGPNPLSNPSVTPFPQGSGGLNGGS